MCNFNFSEDERRTPTIRKHFLKIYDKLNNDVTTTSQSNDSIPIILTNIVLSDISLGSQGGVALAQGGRVGR